MESSSPIIASSASDGALNPHQDNLDAIDRALILDLAGSSNPTNVTYSWLPAPSTSTTTNEPNEIVIQPNPTSPATTTSAGSQLLLENIARTAAYPQQFACTEPGCGRTFKRKTSRTNHMKAHRNPNSRSLQRKKSKRQQTRTKKSTTNRTDSVGVSTGAANQRSFPPVIAGIPMAGMIAATEAFPPMNYLSPVPYQLPVKPVKTIAKIKTGSGAAAKNTPSKMNGPHRILPSPVQQDAGLNLVSMMHPRGPSSAANPLPLSTPSMHSQEHAFNAFSGDAYASLSASSAFFSWRTFPYQHFSCRLVLLVCDLRAIWYRYHVVSLHRHQRSVPRRLDLRSI